MSKTLLLRFALIFIILLTMAAVSVLTVPNNNATPEGNLVPLLNVMTIDPNLSQVVPPDPDATTP